MIWLLSSFTSRSSASQPSSISSRLFTSDVPSGKRILRTGSPTSQLRIPIRLPNNSMEPPRPAGGSVWRDTSLGWPGSSSRGRSAPRCAQSLERVTDGYPQNTTHRPPRRIQALPRASLHTGRQYLADCHATWRRFNSRDRRSRQYRPPKGPPCAAAHRHRRPTGHRIPARLETNGRALAQHRVRTPPTDGTPRTNLTVQGNALYSRTRWPCHVLDLLKCQHHQLHLP